MSLVWYINRLRAMSAPEIAHRLQERRNRSRWRGYEQGWNGFACGDGQLPALEQFGDRLDAAAHADPALATRIAAETRKLVGSEIQLLGQAWPRNALAGMVVADPSLFHRDPVSGRVWPLTDRFCFDVPTRHVTGLGDVKFLCEINRLQFLQVAAAHARLSGDEDLRCRIFDVVFAWMEANTPFRGPNWNSGLELSMRIVTLAIVLSFLGPPTSPFDRLRLRAFVNAHASWLAFYPSRYSSANNHAIAEGLGLLLAGLLVPDLPNSVRHEHEGRALIERQCLLQITSDGVGVEQSPTYTAFAMEMIGFAALVGKLVGRPLKEVVSARLAEAAEHLCWIMNERGETPAIGDNDEGRVLATSIDSDYRYVCSVAACVGCPGHASAPTGRKPEIREALFGAVAATGSALPGPTGVRTFREGGYSVVRGEVAGRPTVLVFDHGPIGYLSIAAHGHADALAVWLDIANRPVLVDAGTWLYHAGGSMRDWFRCTAAHNTVLVEDTSQSLPSGPFNWSHKARARLVDSSDGTSWWFEAAHNGYNARFGVTHFRRIEACAPAEIVISDRLDGKGAPRRVAIQFLLAADLTVSASKAGFEVRRDDGLRMLIVGPVGFEPRLIKASQDSPLGWVSQRFGHRTASVALAFLGNLDKRPAVTRLQLSFEGSDSETR